MSRTHMHGGREDLHSVVSWRNGMIVGSEILKVKLDGLSDVGRRFLNSRPIGNATWKQRDDYGIPSLFIGNQIDLIGVFILISSHRQIIAHSSPLFNSQFTIHYSFRLPAQRFQVSPSASILMKRPPTTERAWNPTSVPSVVQYQSVSGTRLGDWLAQS